MINRECVRFIVLTAFVVLVSVSDTVANERLSKSAACTTPEYRQFDFWVGDWDVFESAGVTKAAHVRVGTILGGCIVYEQYEDPTTLRSGHDDAKTVAALDTEYQAAVKANDAQTMDRILADDFVLVTGTGKTYTKADLLAEARSGRVTYERQEDTEQTVRIWQDVAVVTAKLWEKGNKQGKPFDYKVWFSDVSIRTPAGWKYVFGQSARPLAD